MTYRLYDKAYQSPDDLIMYMQAKGLTVASQADAKTFLESINYYRFKVYLWPFLDATQSSYVPNSTFEQGVELYRFDEELRALMFNIICRVEIKLRSKLDQVVASHTNNPFWYLDDSLLLGGKVRSMSGVRASVASYFQQSKDDYSNHFKQNYFNDTNHNFKQLPPFWVATELMTFGQISTVYTSISKPLFNGPQNTNKLNQLAHEFGARNYVELTSWVMAIRDVRNRCAHHSRVWNVNHRQPSGISTYLDPQYQSPQPNRIYMFCVLLKILDSKLNLGFNVKQKLLDLFATYPAANLKSQAAGFPPNWSQDPVWS
ncbi:Abi family protein [Vibrio genomosp. F6]|uniref:DNA-binding protein n=1 Tax=Vibrio genomosp. F6 str. FF-238 TaxID=1191298 RepID=A0A1E5D911_9VIBR|nr:Abi family protein [Vibrio genomosp. F6]OEE80236.1 DNA-binding protein [Vibrio genomosp. F6 str. FF-238]